MMSAVQLLMMLWEEEEVRLRMQRNEGVIVDLWKPLGRHLGREVVPPRPDDFFNLAGNDPVGELASSELLAMEAARTDQMGTTMARENLNRQDHQGIRSEAIGLPAPQYVHVARSCQILTLSRSELHTVARTWQDVGGCHSSPPARMIANPTRFL